MLPFCTPLSFRFSVSQSLLNNCGVTDYFTYASTDHLNHTECYFTSPTTSILDWSSAYADDKDCHAVINIVTTQACNSSMDIDVSSAPKVYHQALRENRIQFLHKKLILLKPIFAKQRYLSLVIVPASLRRRLFDHYHSGPTGAHMGEYKTLLRMRIRFF